MSREDEKLKQWNGAHSLLIWILGIFILISFSYLGGVNDWLARIIIELLIGLIPILVVLSIFRGGVRELGLLKPSFKEGILALGFGLLGVLAGFLSFYLEVLILGGYPPGYYEFQLKFTPLELEDLLIWIFFSIIVVAPCEEIFSRGFIQKGLQNSGGVIFGLISASILFGLIHMDPFRIFPNAMEGLVLGGAYVYSKNKTSVSAISHAVLNTVIFILMFIFPYYFGI
ncbi:MAG: type II CAAX endopeptidase family protein [Candidatus Odinarchaeota archaeon]